MTFPQRADASEARIFRVVFPNTTNHYDTLFGGTALGYVGEAGSADPIVAVVGLPGPPHPRSRRR